MSPCGGHVGATLLADPRAEAQQCGLRRDLPGDQGLSLAEGDCPVDQARRDEGEDALGERGVRERVSRTRWS